MSAMTQQAATGMRTERRMMQVVSQPSSRIGVAPSVWFPESPESVVIRMSVTFSAGSVPFTDSVLFISVNGYKTVLQTSEMHSDK